MLNGSTGVVVTIPTGLKAPLTVARDSGSTSITFAASGNQLTASIASALAVGSSLSAIARVTQADGAGVLIPVTLTGVAAAPTLSALTLSTSSATVGTAATINIVGATAGSTITGTVPDGMTLNSGARTITGTPTTAGNYNFSLTETLAGATNTPNVSNVSVVVAASGGYTFTNSEASAFVARTQPGMSDAYKAMYDNLVSDLKVGRTNGTNQWATTWDFLLVGTPDGSFKNLLGDSARDATYSTDAPLVAPIYGPTTNGFTSYVEVPLAHNAATYFTQNDAAIWAVNRNPDAKGSSTNCIVGIAGTGTASNTLGFNPRTTTNGASLRLNSTTTLTVASSVTDGSGSHILNRTSSTVVQYFKNGTQVGTDLTNTSAARQAGNFRLGYGLSGYNEDQCMIFGARRSVSAAEAADLEAALTRFKTAMGYQALTIATSTVAAADTSTTLPDIATTNASVTGKGFNPTGFCGDRTDDTFWVSDFGKETQGFGESTFTPRVVHVNAARDTILGTPADLNTLLGATQTAGAQGITERSDNNNLIVVIAGQKVVTVSKAGALVGQFATPLSNVNGITWLSDLGLIALNSGVAIKFFNPDGTNPTVQPNLSVPTPYTGNMDQLDYDASQKAIYVSGGANGAAGFVLRIGYNDQNYGFWRPSRAVTLTGDNQLEGIARRGGTLFTANDSYGHGAGGAGFNRTATRADPFA